MCDNCTCEELKDNDIQQEEMSEDEFMEMLGSLKSTEQPELTYFREPMEFDDEEMSHMVNSSEFIKGQSDANYWVGYWNCLLNGSIPEQLAIEITCSHQQNLANEVIQSMNVDMNKEMSKNQLIVAEKSQL